MNGLLVAYNGRLLTHDNVHVCLNRVYVLADEDLVFLGLIPIRIKSGCQVIDLVLQCRGRIDRVLLLGWRWWCGWGLGG